MAKAILVLGSMSGCASAPSQPGSETETARLDELVVYSQSIGRGVPPEAKASLQRVIELLQASGIEAAPQMWGLEGEQRICVQISSEQAKELAPEVARIASGIELLKFEHYTDSDIRCK